MNLIIDAGVAVKWFVDEERRDQARDVLREDFELAAPDLLLAEVANALRNKVRVGMAAREQAQAALTELPGLFDSLIGPRETLHEAFELPCRINHPVADCVYLACAKLLNATLLTDDDTLFQKAGALEFGARTLRLRDWTPGLAANPTG